MIDSPSSSEKMTALVHLLRAEVTRSNVWRQRLDTTTNWAVLATGAALSFAFGERDLHHSVILINMLLITLFWGIESRRYRYYELWSQRVRLLETGVFAPLLDPTQPAPPNALSQLATSLHQPTFPIGMREALGRRLRRNYIWLYSLLAVTWLLKITLLTPSAGISESMVERATIGYLPGEIVIFVVTLAYGLLVLFALTTRHLRQATGEVWGTHL